ncbi:hypothetical protein [Priestia aryabhattai]
MRLHWDFKQGEIIFTGKKEELKALVAGKIKEELLTMAEADAIQDQVISIKQQDEKCLVRYFVEKEDQQSNVSPTIEDAYFISHKERRISVASIKRLDLPFEIKSMGVSYYAPFVAVLLGMMYVTFSSSPDVIRYTSIIVEFVVCPFAAWWSMYLFYDYYEDQASEVLFSYPLSSFFHGIIRVTSFFIVFLVAFFIFLVTITIKHPDISLIDLSILYVPQTILYCYLGFTLMTLSRTSFFPC